MECYPETFEPPKHYSLSNTSHGVKVKVQVMQRVKGRRRHFAGQTGLVQVAVDADDLGPQLRWEPSRGGALFPHLYGPLPTSRAASVQPIPDERA